MAALIQRNIRVDLGQYNRFIAIFPVLQASACCMNELDSLTIE